MTLIEPDISIPETTTDHDDDSKHAHIVLGKAQVTEAYIEGTAVTALCGYVWVPSRDPSSLPLCSKCKEIREGLANANNNHED